MNREQQLYDENTCANIFLKWLGGEQRAEWMFRRAEDEFPELKNTTRWEFVAHRTDRNQEWIALEVKSLVFPEGDSQYWNWHKLVDYVNKKVEHKLPGKFWLAHLPKYTFDQNQKTTLEDCLERVTQEAAQSLGKGEQKNIGPSIAACFSHWPKDTTKQPTGIDPGTWRPRLPPHPLLLQRGSCEGGSLVIAAYPFVGYWVEPALKAAVQGLLAKNGRANKQLGVAKSKGASKTILLFDERIDFDPQGTAQVIGGLDTSHLSNIDEVYLVSTFGGEHVKQLWSKPGNKPSSR